MADLDDRPQKKRRFFVDNLPAQDPSLTAEPSLPDEVNNLPETPTTRRQPSNLIANHDKENAFDAEAFKAFTGAEPPAETIASLQQTFGKDIERAINAYFDGSWKSAPAPAPAPVAPSRAPSSSVCPSSPFTNPPSSMQATPRARGSPHTSATPVATPAALKPIPAKR